MANKARTKIRGEKEPVVAYPSAEPTKTGAALATKNFGREARKRIINFECSKRDFILIEPKTN